MTGKQQVIEIYRAHPEYSGKQIATETGLTSSYVYTLLGPERERKVQELQALGRGGAPAAARFSVEDRDRVPAVVQPENTTRDGPTAKQLAVLKIYRANPEKTKREIATEAGVTYSYVMWIVNLEKCSEIGKQRRLQESLLPALVNDNLCVDVSHRQWDTSAVAIAQSRAQTLDVEVLQGVGETRCWEDVHLIGLFDGVIGMVRCQLTALGTVRSQMEWDVRSHELSLTAAFCDSSVAPVASKGMYRGLRGDQFFRQLAKYLRQRVAAGPFGC
jgi:hypothetical protein